MESILTLAKKHFEHPETVESYSQAVNRIGLWKSEELILTKVFEQKQTLLELGCGTGRISFGLYKLGYRYLRGIDLSEGMIAQAREIAASKEWDIPFEVKDATALDIPDTSVDGVIFGFNGLMQIPGAGQRQQAIEEVFRILKPGGAFVFTSHDRDLPRYRAYWEQEPAPIIDFGDRLYETPQGHCFIHIPTQTEVISALTKAGFAVEGNALRSEIAQENSRVWEFSDDCRFWVGRKRVDIKKA